MVLPRNVYQVLEDIVGPRNISDEDVILDAYAFQWMAEVEAGGKFFTRPEAVVLPQSVEEVQAIVKACNEHKIRFKAFSTGWGPWNAPGSEGVIQLDLRRMNRILEIDEKNMFAVVEPYIICSQLQVEAMKRGLNCHIVGAGANTSPLASCTSMSGMGLSGVSMSYNARNPLAVEWVLPSGEILKLGALGSGAGWFCGDGPGPSLRGIMRGAHGAMGGMGVFTKCAVKLYPWPGPRSLQIDGTTPNYTAPVPENCKCYLLGFPSWESFADTAYKIAEAEIAYVMGKQTGARLGPIRADRMADPSGREARCSSNLVLAAHSSRELKYQNSVVEEILAETDGWIAAVTHSRAAQEIMFRMLIKVDMNTTAFRFSGSFGTSFGAETSCDATIVHAKAAEGLKQKYIDMGVIADDGVEWAWGGEMNEQGRFSHLEEIFFYDPADPKSVKGAREFIEESSLMCKEQALGLPIWELVRGGLGPGAHDIYGPSVSNYQVWQRRIKKAFDANVASDPSFYIEPGED